MGGDIKMDCEFVRLKIKNYGDLGWQEFLNLCSGIIGEPTTIYIVDTKGPIYSIIHPATTKEKTFTVLTRWIIPITEEETSFLNYCKERCTLKDNCINNCALIKYKKLLKERS